MRSLKNWVTFDVYGLLDLGTSSSFVSLHVEIILKFFLKNFVNSFLFFTPVRMSILAEWVYRDCHISINHKKTMADLVELDIVDFDVIFSSDWLQD